MRWIVKPEGAARFNTDFRADFTREIRFSKPGTYTLTAISAAYGPESTTSNTVTVKVVQ